MKIDNKVAGGSSKSGPIYQSFGSYINKGTFDIPCVPDVIMIGIYAYNSYGTGYAYKIFKLNSDKTAYGEITQDTGGYYKTGNTGVGQMDASVVATISNGKVSVSVAPYFSSSAVYISSVHCVYA